MEITIFDRLRIMLHQMFPEAKDAASGNTVRINCPLCEQSGDPDHDRHMYINLGLNDKPPMYNCFRRTGHSGLLTLSALERFGGQSQYLDTDLVLELEKYFKHRSKLMGYQGNTIRKNNVFIPNQLFGENEKQNIYNLKKEYLSSRLGVDFSYEMIRENKIVLSLYDFLRYNNITKLTMDKNMCDVLDTYFIGFLTNSNTSLIMRNCIKDPNKIPNHTMYHEMRYVKYGLSPNAPLSYYIIPSECDIYQPIEVHMAEGTFDILSVFYNLKNADRKNKIYAAIGSKAYLNLIKYFLIGIGLIMVEFHIYIDSTIERDILDEIKRLMYPLDIKVTIHINTFTGEKDFGVPKERIADYSYIL